MTDLQMATYVEHYKDFIFPNDRFTEAELEEALLKVSGNALNQLTDFSFKSPSTCQIISVFPGSLGVDRFYLGDIKMGIFKYFTMGGLGILWIADIISAKKRCLNANAKRLMEFISTLPVDEGQSADDSTDVSALITSSEEAKKKKINIDGKTAIALGKGVFAIGKSIADGVKAFQDSNDPTKF